MSKKMEEIIRETLEGHELPYNPAHWSEMEQMLDKQVPAPKSGNDYSWLKMAAAGAGLVAASYILYICLQPSATIQEHAHTETKQHLTEQIEVNHNITIDIPEHTPANQQHTPIVKETQQTEEQQTIEVNPETETQVSVQTENVSPAKQKENTNTPAELPLITFMANKVSGCGSVTVLFTPDKKDENLRYLWQFGDGQTSTEMNAVHTYSVPGEYKASLLISHKNNARLERKAGNEQTIKVFALPNAEFALRDESLEHDNNRLKYPYVEYTAIQKDAVQYSWTMNGKSLISGISGKTLIHDKGDYTFILQVTDKNNCKNTKTQYIHISKDFSVFAPNAFTPNGDDINDEFIPKALEEYAVDYTLTVIDQQSKPVFISNSGNKAWNGRLNNTGNMLEQGTYFWFAETTDAYGNKHAWKGQVFLQR